MNRFKRYIVMAALAFSASARSAMASMASTKVTKGTVVRVEEAKKQEEETRAAEETKAAEEATAAATARATAAQEVSVRQQVVDYILSFVDGRYVWDGTDPHSGTGCSGFTRYTSSYADGVSISHSSAEQAGEGRIVTVDSVQPGDLPFYSRGGGVNHVTIYIDNGQVIHASSSKTSVIVSAWNYRIPVCITSYPS